MTRYAVVDLEATDAHSISNKIIQIGIVIIEDNEIVDTYATEVNPHQRLSGPIRSLTGLKDKQLAQAPDFKDVAKDVKALLENSVFVAHNAQFDYSLLMKSFMSIGFSDMQLPRIDTVDLARVFYPTFDRYGLEALSQELKLSHERPHEALSDAYATAELLLKIKKKIQHLPRVVVEEIIQHADHLLFETKDFIKEQLKDTQLKPKGLRIVHQLATKIPQKIKPAQALSLEFEDNIKALGYTPRQTQTDLANTIEEEQYYEQASFIEASTGLGKTYAYLLPLLSSGKNIIASTPTKILQEQLIKEVGQPLEKKFHIHFTKLLGTKNYIHLEKFSRLLLTNTDGKNFEIFKVKILVWLTETDTGELDELSKVMTNKNYFAQVAHDGYVNTKNFYYEQDFWLKAQALANQSQVKVVNHAYLVERLKDYAEEFLKDSVLVIDEAQELFSIMEKSGQQSVNVKKYFTDLKEEGLPILQERLMESLAFQLEKKKFDLEKIKLDASELGFTELENMLQADNRFVWKEGEILYSSELDFYNFAGLVPHTTKLYMIGASLSLTEEKKTYPELLGFEDYRFFTFGREQVKNQQMIIVTDSPAVKNISQSDYAEYLADSILQLRKKKLPILILFTSKASLQATAEILSKRRANFLAQDIHGTADVIKRKFDKNESRILLGLASFWEGVDFNKQDKLLLMITRLPFSTPEDILTKKYAARFDNPFYDFNVPMATLKLQQAIGRVNRR
ncbi:MAG: exonuclease domain-containing protein, partial [Streptococcaceae bacterium]|nr:exonuclease domain-containing protein [Streptococcaceae bacterium]